MIERQKLSGDAAEASLAVVEPEQAEAVAPGRVSGLANQLLRGAAGSFLIKIGGAGTSLALQVVLARLLGPEHYGIYVYTWTWVTVAALLSTFGFTTASVRYVAEYEGQEAWGYLRGFLRFSARWVWICSWGVAVTMVAVARLLTDGWSDPYFQSFVLAGFSLPMFAQVQVRGAVLRGLKRVVHGQLPQYVLFPGLLLVLALAAMLGVGVERTGVMVMGLNAIAATLTLGWVTYRLRRSLPAPVSTALPRVEAAEWRRTAAAMILIAGFNLAILQTDTLMVGSLVGTTASGIYHVASKIAGLLVFVLVAVNAILSPMAAQLYSRGDQDALQRVLTLATQVVFGVSLLVAFAIGIAREFVLGVFGAAFVEGASVLWVLMGAQLINAFSGPAMMLLNMTGHQNVSARILGMAAVLNIALNAALIPLWGEMGAALATSITVVLWNVLAVVAVHRRLGLVSTAILWKRN